MLDGLTRRITASCGRSTKPPERSNRKCTAKIVIGGKTSIAIMKIKLAKIFAGTKIKNIDQLSYSYNEGGAFQTGPMFGCVHFRAASNNGFDLTRSR